MSQNAKSDIDLNELYTIIENLSVDDRAKLAHKLLGHNTINVIIGNNNNYSAKGSIFFQIHALDRDTLNEVFDKLDKEAISKLLDAISQRIAKEP